MDLEKKNKKNKQSRLQKKRKPFFKHWCNDKRKQNSQEWSNLLEIYFLTFFLSGWNIVCTVSTSKKGILHHKFVHTGLNKIFGWILCLRQCCRYCWGSLKKSITISKNDVKKSTSFELWHSWSKITWQCCQFYKNKIIFKNWGN